MEFIDKLRVFVAVAEHQSLARAAEALQLHRPRVTNAVAELEKELGTRLLHRTTRKTALTREGATFYDQAKATLTAVSDARNFFDGGSAKPKGRIRVDMSNSIARSTIIPRLGEFKAAYPDVEVALGVSDQQVDLISEGVDCVLRLGQLGTTSMVSRLVGHVQMVTCASPAYLSAHGAPQTLEELKAHRAVVYFHGKDRRVMDWEYVENGVTTLIRMPPAVLVNDHEAYVSCAVNGLGVAQMPKIGVQDRLAAGELVPFLESFEGATMPLSLLYPARKHLPLQTRAFMDWAVSIFDARKCQTAPGERSSS